jgi:hypothetical protein
MVRMGPPSLLGGGWTHHLTSLNATNRSFAGRSVSAQRMKSTSLRLGVHCLARAGKLDPLDGPHGGEAAVGHPLQILSAGQTLAGAVKRWDRA